MDRDLRNALRTAVVACRQILEAEVWRQLEGTYGVTRGGQFLAREEFLSYGAAPEAWDRERAAIGAALQHIESTGISRSVAVEQFVRETAFTTLNRLVALKLMEHESRGLIMESVGRGKESKGFVLFQKVSPEVCRTAKNGDVLDGGYRLYLELLFDDLATELGVLFDRQLPQAIIFPSDACLKHVLDHLNHPDLVLAWGEDETIGWVYQYFTPKELRDQARAESSAPRNAYELAFRNQFYTPRYVVQFLTDNTLGRIWWEMRRGETALAERCGYLVRRKRSVFMTPGELAPDIPGAPRGDIEYVAHRPKKDPRDLRVLDPACGSGHFLLYAYDLLTVIYEEAWGDPESPPSEATGRSLREDYPSLDHLRAAIPGLILRHNLHGIDIDLRATQIAALALWLRAQRSFQGIGLKVADRPPVTRSNIVCAEPMPGERSLLDNFVAGLQPRVLGQLVRAVFERMDTAGGLGPLLKIEDAIQGVVAEAKRQWLQAPKQEQMALWPEQQRPEIEQTGLFDVRGVTDERFWAEADGRVLESLRAYAERATDGDRYRRRLFSDDAAGGFAFVEALRERFDVVLMNPPFGEPIPDTKPYLKAAYPWIPWKDCNLLAAFVGRGLELCNENGYLGAITSRAGMFLTSFEAWRKEVLLARRLVTLADLGYGVMEGAMVEAAAYVVGASPRRVADEAVFLRLLKDTDRPAALAGAIAEACEGKNSQRVYPVALRELEEMPGSPFAYWVAPSIRALFHQLPPLDGNGAEIRVGLQTSDDFRFIRAFWEVDATTIARSREETVRGKRWVPFAKGGEYSPYYADIHLVVDWEDDGRRIRESGEGRVQNTQYYFRPGITWPERTTSGFSPVVLPAECVFSVTGPGAFPADEPLGLLLLMSLNDRVVRVMVDSLVPAGEETVSGTAARHYGVGLVQRLPWIGPRLNHEVTDRLSNLARHVVETRVQFDEGDETTRRFVCPDVLRASSRSLVERVKVAWDTREASIAKAIDAVLEAEAILHRALGLDDEAERYLDEEYGQNPGAYPRDDLDDGADLARLYQMPIDGLIDHVVASRGGSRTIATKSYFLDRRLEVLAHVFERHPAAIVKARHQLGLLPPEEPRRSAETVLSWAVGCALGRWDVRLGTRERRAPDLPDPFAPVPVCPPGMLQGEDGLPAREAPPDYPFRIAWDGILVDDPGHADDIVRRVRDVLALLWGDRAEAIEKEACEILGVQDLRDYFRNPRGFFEDHIRRYSKSRRKAPIYWLLQSPRRSYGLWLYYHRLNKDTVFKALRYYIEPKIRGEMTRLKELRARLDAEKDALPRRERTKREKTIEEQDALITELGLFKQALEQVAALDYEPDPNDGVVLNIAPFHELTPWQEAKASWAALLAGKYEWSIISRRLKANGVLAR
jgi:hypothetical protein